MRKVKKTEPQQLFVSKTNVKEAVDDGNFDTEAEQSIAQEFSRLELSFEEPQNPKNISKVGAVPPTIKPVNTMSCLSNDSFIGKKDVVSGMMRSYGPG